MGVKHMTFWLFILVKIIYRSTTEEWEDSLEPRVIKLGSYYNVNSIYVFL